MRLTRRLEKIEKTVQNLPDPRQDAEEAERSRRTQLTMDLASTDPRARELLVAYALRLAHDEIGDPKGYDYDEECCRGIPTPELWAMFSARIETLMEQHGLSDIEEWAPVTWGVREALKARQQAARVKENRLQRGAAPTPI